MANYKRVDNSFFFDGGKSHIAKGWLLYALFLIAPIAVAFNVWFYFRVEGPLRAFSLFWVWAFVTILMIAQYVFPLMWQQDEPNVWLAIRNAALLTARHPLYSLLMLIFELILLTLSTALTLPLLILAPSMLSLCGNLALVGLLQEMDMGPEPPVMSNT